MVCTGVANEASACAQETNRNGNIPSDDLDSYFDFLVIREVGFQPVDSTVRETLRGDVSDSEINSHKTNQTQIRNDQWYKADIEQYNGSNDQPYICRVLFFDDNQNAAHKSYCVLSSQSLHHHLNRWKLPT